MSKTCSMHRGISYAYNIKMVLRPCHGPGPVEVQVHTFLTLALGSTLPLRKRAYSTNWIGGLVSPRAGLDI
jgi:hypothetical protein